MFYKLFVAVILSEILITNAELWWNATDISDKGCVFPPSIVGLYGLNQELLDDTPRGLKLYAPFASQGFYRWVYHKAKNTPALTQDQVDSIKMLIEVQSVGTTKEINQLGKVYIFDPPSASYEVNCSSPTVIPTNSTCSVINASEGSAPFGFGCGDPMITTVVWSDITSYLEWHCFEGDIQIF